MTEQARVLRLEHDLAARVREVETLNGHVAQLTGALARRGHEVERLNADVAGLTQALATRGSEVERLGLDVAGLTQALATRGGEVERLGLDVAGLTQALATRGGEVEKLGLDVARLTQALDERGREVSELTTALAVRGREVETLDASLRNQQEALRTRELEVLVLHESLARLAPAEALPGGPAEAAPAPRPVPAIPAPPRSAVPSLAREERPRPSLDLRGLAWTLVRTDLKVRYHESLGGLLWVLAKPLSTLAVLLAVFGWLFSGRPDYALDLVVGILVWDLFAEGTRAGLVSLAIKGHLIAKTVFPRWILVVTSLAHASIPFAVFSLGLLVALAAQQRLPGPLGLLAYLACALQLAGIVLGLSLASSVLLLRYRDLNQIWDVLLQAGFFAAPVVYPLEMVPPAVRPFLRLWPPTAAIEYARTVMVHRELPGLDVQAVLAALTILSLGLGLAVYRRHEPAIAELV